MSNPYKLIGQGDGQHPKPGLPIFHIYNGKARGNHARFYARRRGPPLWCCLLPILQTKPGAGPQLFHSLNNPFTWQAGYPALFL